MINDLKIFISDVMKERKKEVMNKQKKLDLYIFRFHTIDFIAFLGLLSAWFYFKINLIFFLGGVSLLWLIRKLSERKFLEATKRNIKYDVVEVDEREIISKYIKENEIQIMLSMHNFINDNKQNPLYNYLQKKFETIKLDVIDNNWDNVILVLPSFLEKLNKIERDNKKEVEEKMKIEKYNETYITSNIKEKEIGVNYEL